MITGKKKLPLTIDNILKLVSEYDIFRYFVSDKQWKLNQVFLSPLRDEKNPSFIIGNKGGNLHFFDFTTGVGGDCFTFVKELYSLSSIDDVLRIIDKEMGLGFTTNTNTGEYKIAKKEYKQPEEIKEKHYSIIQCITRKFTQEELNYWGEYYQSIQDLRENNIYSIAKVYLNRQLFPLKETELRFGYLYDDHWKIYKPFSSKKTKWVPNNVPITAMDGKDCITNCKTAFITKSKKDFLVIKKVFPCTCAVQNESVGCFSDENVEFLKANSDRQVLGFDSDVPGVESSQQITKLFDFGYCNVPRRYLSEGINDFADLGKIHGLQAIAKHFKEKGIISNENI